ncbi:hypothetical protein K2X33_04000 [bacterium]|nr:hypothetical protein [bacterium]
MMNATNKLKTATAEATGAAEDVASNLKSVGQSIWGQAGEIKDAAVDKARDLGEMASDEAQSLLKNHPGPVLAAGFGVGLLVGFLVARR